MRYQNLAPVSSSILECFKDTACVFMGGPRYRFCYDQVSWLNLIDGGSQGLYNCFVIHCTCKF